MSRRSTIFRRSIALPQDHGSWVFILSPLLIGLFAGGKLTIASVMLSIACMMAFLVRQPVSIFVKSMSGRRSRQDIGAASTWIIIYSLLIFLPLAVVVLQGYAFILYLAIPGLIVFAWHLFLISRRRERRQAGVEIIATGVLALAAPAAFWVGRGMYDPAGWTLWLLVWLQSAASIVYAYLRLAQRELESIPDIKTRFKMGFRALSYTGFNLIVSVIGVLSGFLPSLLFLPFLLQWSETVWGVTHPAVRMKPTAIGIRQLIVSSLFTLLFIVTWR